MASKVKRLSSASQIWDAENKGYLTEVQQQLRDLDENGTGTLSSDKLSNFGAQMKSLSTENKQLKRMLIVLGVLNVLFFIGTVTGIVLVVKANKEVSVTKDGLAVSSSTGIPMRTEAQGFTAKSTFVVDEETGITHECIKNTEIAKMYDAYGNGMTVTHEGGVVGVGGTVDAVDPNTEILPIRVASGDAHVRDDQVHLSETMSFFLSNPDCDRLLGEGEVRRNLSDKELFALVLKQVRVQQRNLGGDSGSNGGSYGGWSF